VRPYRELASSAINLSGGAGEKVCGRRKRLKRSAKGRAIVDAVFQFGRKYPIEDPKREGNSTRARGAVYSSRPRNPPAVSNTLNLPQAGKATTVLSCPRTDI
jgi:hypothetical protein